MGRCLINCGFMKAETIGIKDGSTLAYAIASHSFVAGMKPEYLQRLQESAMFKQFDRDELIFREGEPANRFYLICSGKIMVESRGTGEKTSIVQLLGEGDVLGWSWLFPPYYWHFGARTIEATSAIFFYGTRLREQCDDDPAFGYDLMKRVAAIVIKRLQITRAQLIQLQQTAI
jgi:CRP/FNR family transcriptional regulator, cyclic AMP receptor protein